MRLRRFSAIVLAALTLPVLMFGLIDPLEGGIALLVAAGLVAATWWLSKIGIPRLEWASWTAAIVFGVVAIAWAVTLWSPAERATGQGISMPWPLLALLIAYELAVVSTLVGGVVYLVRLIRSA